MNKSIKTVLPLAALAGMTLTANAAVTMSLGTPIAGIVMGSETQNGDVVHTDGLQMNGFAGNWGNNTGTNTTSQGQGSSNGYTFTWNVGGAAQVWGWTGATTPEVRTTYTYINRAGNRYTGAVPWRIEGLTPGTSYDIIMYGTDRNPDTSTAQFAIPGYNSGNPVVLDAEGDANFMSVVADGSGYISGTLDAPVNSAEARLTGIQIAELAPIPEPATTALLGLGGLALILRRRK